MRRYVSSATAWALLSALAATVLLFSLWQGDAWPGTPNGCREFMRPNCFCERLTPGLIAQPVNTWSNLAFILAGVSVGVHADRARRRRTGFLYASPVYPAVFASAIALLGPGSMALHATMTIWGGRVDVTSMYVFIGLVVAWGLTRLYELSGPAFAGLYAVILLGLIATKFVLPINSDFVFGAMVGVATVINVVLVRRRPEIVLRHRYVLAAAGFFAAAFAVWLPSRTGGPLCAPDFWLQGHAVWHGLCAAAASCIYLYAGSEQHAEAPSA